MLKTVFLILSLLSAGVASAAPITVMSYNTENLFDTSFDVGTDDTTYLPKALKEVLPGHAEACAKNTSEFRKKQCLYLDWTPEKLAKKITGIGQVIRSFDQSGRGPDVVVFQEVENRQVLDSLVDIGLGGLGHDHRILIEGDDTRGIDVAVISRYPIIAAERHLIIIDGRRLDTRGILEVTLQSGQKTVVIYANHWPSQSNPTSQRIAAAQLLEELAARRAADLIIALGDFNTTVNDDPFPFSFMPSFVDAEERARELGPLFPGTTYYAGTWNSLDKIFVHHNSRSPIDYANFQIIHHGFLLRPELASGELIPYRYDHETAQGYSDHLPVGMKIDL